MRHLGSVVVGGIIAVAVFYWAINNANATFEITGGKQGAAANFGKVARTFQGQ